MAEGGATLEGALDEILARFEPASQRVASVAAQKGAYLARVLQ